MSMFIYIWANDPLNMQSEVLTKLLLHVTLQTSLVNQDFLEDIQKKT